MNVFEDRSTYDPKADSVATVTLTVECNPGEVSSITDFLVGTSSKAGVYSVAVDHVVHVPEVTTQAVEVLTVSIGEAHGEQPLQHADPDHSGEDLGREGSLPTEGDAAAIGAERVDRELAGTPGEDGAGSGERDT